MPITPTGGGVSPAICVGDGGSLENCDPQLLQNCAPAVIAAAQTGQYNWLDIWCHQVITIHEAGARRPSGATSYMGVQDGVKKCEDSAFPPA